MDFFKKASRLFRRNPALKAVASNATENLDAALSARLTDIDNDIIDTIRKVELNNPFTRRFRRLSDHDSVGYTLDKEHSYGRLEPLSDLYGLNSYTSKEDIVFGILKDEDELIRGFWFENERYALDKNILRRAANRCGKDVLSSDYDSVTLGLCKATPFHGGYAVVFPSSGIDW